MTTRLMCAAVLTVLLVPSRAWAQAGQDLVVVFPGLTQKATGWDRYRADAPRKGFELLVPEFPSIDGQPGVRGHIVNERTIEATMAKALSRLSPGERLQVVLYLAVGAELHQLGQRAA